MKIAVGLVLALLSLAAHATDKIRVIVATNVSRSELAASWKSPEFELSTEADNGILLVGIGAYQQDETVVLSVAFNVKDPWTERWLVGSHTPYVCSADKLPACAQAIFQILAKETKRLILYREMVKETTPRTQPLP